jgi:hypothetical protein
MEQQATWWARVKTKRPKCSDDAIGHLARQTVKVALR